MEKITYKLFGLSPWELVFGLALMVVLSALTLLACSLDWHYPQ